MARSTRARRTDAGQRGGEIRKTSTPPHRSSTERNVYGERRELGGGAANAAPHGVGGEGREGVSRGRMRSKRSEPPARGGAPKLAPRPLAAPPFAARLRHRARDSGGTRSGLLCRHARHTPGEDCNTGAAAIRHEDGLLRWAAAARRRRRPAARAARWGRLAPRRLARRRARVPRSPRRTHGPRLPRAPPPFFPLAASSPLPPPVCRSRSLALSRSVSSPRGACNQRGHGGARRREDAKGVGREQKKKRELGCGSGGVLERVRAGALRSAGAAAQTMSLGLVRGE